MSIPSIPKIALPKAPDPNVDPAGYLRSIGAVRERCGIILEKAKNNDLNHFEVDMGRFKDTTKFVVSIIKVFILDCAHVQGPVLTFLAPIARFRTRL